jgi:hypothetical protein
MELAVATATMRATTTVVAMAADTRKEADMVS